MKIAPVAEIKTHFSAYLKESEKGPIVVTKNGKPVAVLLNIVDEEDIERLLIGYSPKFRSILNKGRQQIKKTGGVRHDAFWEEIGTSE
ncbi:MAG: type II toxin-antitoxin system Phd/YefM family antitoxin [Deltaproteobacteria bacterium]|nr:type II toxin-antitoxin system Phd/YefM family antitoxin [Deltaproteobacteria bacterium]